MHIHIPLRFELLHDVEEVVVDLGLVAKLELDLVQVRQCILHLQCRNTQQYSGASLKGISELQIFVSCSRMCYVSDNGGHPEHSTYKDTIQKTSLLRTSSVVPMIPC